MPRVQRRKRRSSFFRRLAEAFRAPITLTHVGVGLLLFSFGFAFAGQSTAAREDELSSLSQSEIITLLDELREKNQRLRADETKLQTQIDELETTSDARGLAAQAAQKRKEAIALSAGQTKATGSGVTITITDPERAITSGSIVNLLGELRNAGAKAVEISGVRVIASTAVTKSGNDLMVDGVKIAPPYRVKAIGDSHTISVALEIPGGALSFLKTFNAQVNMSENSNLTIDTLAATRTYKWAQPIN